MLIHVRNVRGHKRGGRARTVTDSQCTLTRMGTRVCKPRATPRYARKQREGYKCAGAEATGRDINGREEGWPALASHMFDSNRFGTFSSLSPVVWRRVSTKGEGVASARRSGLWRTLPGDLLKLTRPPHPPLQPRQSLRPSSIVPS